MHVGCKYVFMHVYMYVCICIYIYTYVYICIYVPIYIYTHIHIYTYACMCIYRYIHNIHTNKHMAHKYVYTIFLPICIYRWRSSPGTLSRCWATAASSAASCVRSGLWTPWPGGDNHALPKDHTSQDFDYGLVSVIMPSWGNDMTVDMAVVNIYTVAHKVTNGMEPCSEYGSIVSYISK